MATNLYTIDRTKSLGSQLLNLLERIDSDFAAVKSLFAAMTQQKDGNTGTATDFVTPTATFGYSDTTVAQASYAEINSFIGNAGPSLEQCAARHRQ